MQPRQLLIVIVAAVAAFGVAFGVSSASGGEQPKTKAAPPLEGADVIEVGDATVNAAVPDATKLPALKVPTPEPKTDTSTDTSSTTTTTTTQSTDTTSSTTTTATPQDTTTTTPQDTTKNDGGSGGFQVSGAED